MGGGLTRHSLPPLIPRERRRCKPRANPAARMRSRVSALDVLSVSSPGLRARRSLGVGGTGQRQRSAGQNPTPRNPLRGAAVRRVRFTPPKGVAIVAPTKKRQTKTGKKRMKGPEDDEGLAGKVALISGGGAAGDGIGNGRAAAILLARAGARIMVADLDLKLAERTAEMIREEGGTATAVANDVTREADCKALVE